MSQSNLVLHSTCASLWCREVTLPERSKYVLFPPNCLEYIMHF